VGAADGLLDRRDAHPVVLDELGGIAGLSEAVVYADELDRRGVVLRENLRDARAHPALLLMLLDGHECAARACGVEYRAALPQCDLVVVLPAEERKAHVNQIGVLAGRAVASAAKTCKEYMAPSGPPPALTEAQRQTAIADAECMRMHGLSNFPDPTFSGGNEQLNLGPGLNLESPAVEAASKACGGAPRP